ncbi:MAG: hypothetical protein VYC40_00260 [Pseudomonadota bacterium]|nr:hypothetical protein [Pseudomonadota bacterium]
MNKGCFLTATVGILLGSSAIAGGFDNSYFPDDIFFGKSRIQGSISRTEINAIGKLTVSGVTKTTNDIYVKKISPVGGIRYNINSNFSIVAQTHKPYRANTRYDTGFFHAVPTFSSLETQLDTLALGYKLPMSSGQISVIAGMNRFNGMGGFGTDVMSGGVSVGTVDVNDLKFKESYFPAFGLGYEIPDMAMRVSAMYYAESKTTAKGIFSSSTAALATASSIPTTGISVHVDKMVISPSRLHLHAQSGVHPKWLLLAGYIFAEWSKSPSLIVKNSASDQTLSTQSLFNNNAHYFYGGLGHLFNKRTRLTSVFFWEPLRDEPLTGLRTPSRGGVSSALFGASYDATKHINIGLNYSFIHAAATRIEVAATPAQSGVFPASNGHKFAASLAYQI